MSQAHTLATGLKKAVEIIDQTGKNTNDKGDSQVSIETKQLGGNVVEVKQEDRDGVPVGIVAGYIATWDLDRGAWGVRDKFIKGAFLESINELKARNRPVRLKDHHGRTVGGFPISTVHEDERGLFGIGEINLEVQQGREAYSLAKQGILSDFSIGFSSVEDIVRNTEHGDVREISKAVIWEGSIVDEPMNPEANIISVKSNLPFSDLPIAPRETEWDAEAALQRVKTFTKSDTEPSEGFSAAYLTVNPKVKGFEAYQLPIADIVDNTLTVIPRALFAAAALLKGGQGGIELKEKAKEAAISHLERYYTKMDLDSPFAEDKAHFSIDIVKEWGVKEIETGLHETGMFSKSAARFLAGKMKGETKSPAAYNESDLGNLLAEIKGLTNTLTEKNN